MIQNQSKVADKIVNSLKNVGFDSSRHVNGNSISIMISNIGKFKGTFDLDKVFIIDEIEIYEGIDLYNFNDKLNIIGRIIDHITNIAEDIVYD